MLACEPLLMHDRRGAGHGEEIASERYVRWGAVGRHEGRTKESIDVENSQLVREEGL